MSRLQEDSTAASHVLIALAAALVGAGLFSLASTLWPVQPPPTKCLTTKVLVEHPYFPGEAAMVGEAQICGQNLSISGIYGPSIEEWRRANEAPKGERASR